MWGTPHDPSLTEGPVQLRTSAKQMTNHFLPDEGPRVRRGWKHHAPAGSLGEMELQSSLTSEVGQLCCW